MESGLQQFAEASTPPHVYASLIAQLPELSRLDSPLTIHEDVVLDKTGTVRRRQVRRRWAVVAAVGIAVAIGGPLPIPSLYNVALVVFGRYWQEQPRGRTLSHLNENKRKAILFDRTQHLRDLWRVQAIQHKTALRQMLRADGQNETALQWAVQALPVFLPETGTGLTRKDIASFTWQPAARYRGGTPYRLREDFAQYHDIALSRSTGYNNPNYVLWASGRITEETQPQRQPFIPNISGFPLPPQQREVVPPYEELTRNP